MPDVRRMRTIQSGCVHIKSVTATPIRTLHSCQCKVVIETPSVVTYIDEPDEHGGIIRHIQAVDISQDTVMPGTLMAGVTAHNRLGQQIIGTATGGDPYDGPYIVIPKVEGQTLETDGKTMQDDVTVTAIPYYQTSNPQGGYTVIIGD